MTTNPYIAFFESWLKNAFTVPASTLPTMTPAVAETDIMKGFSEVEALIAAVKGLWNDVGYQAKIRDGLNAALSADELVSIVFPQAAVGEIPLTLAISALPILFYAMGLKWVAVEGTGGVSFMTPEFARSWANDPRHKLNKDGSFKS
jgi:hypothetical protein